MLWLGVAGAEKLTGIPHRSIAKANGYIIGACNKQGPADPGGANSNCP